MSHAAAAANAPDVTVPALGGRHHFLLRRLHSLTGLVFGGYLIVHRLVNAPIAQFFVGEILQRPPAYSAMKVGGRRAYDLARGGQVVELETRPVRVYGIEVLAYEWPLLRLRIDCGRGTYIRSLARDVGEALGVGGYLTTLRRTRVGAFDVSAAVTADALKAGGVEKHFHPPPAGP